MNKYTPIFICFVLLAPSFAMSSLAMVTLPNPASAQCNVLGGQSMTETLPNGAEFGVCHFDDNRQCGEWALLRGDCPVGGVRVTGYTTPEQRYCALTGGQLGGKDNLEICTMRNGEVCVLADLFKGICPSFTKGRM